MSSLLILLLKPIEVKYMTSVEKFALRKFCAGKGITSSTSCWEVFYYALTASALECYCQMFAYMWNYAQLYMRMIKRYPYQ